MDSTVIVALPRVDDKVYKISSEKVPHLTLCFLGNTADLDLEAIVLFVQHAASQLSPFGLSVDYRGTLGPDDADVLFFKKDSWSFPRINDFRGHLLQNDAIRRGYDSVDQYPEWTPHLTLGYPAAPAHEDDSEHPGMNYVDFDRIAVWSSDSEGPEFRLKYMEDNMADSVAAWSSMTTAEKGAAAVGELFHFGKKGMKWGVRNDPGHEGEQVKTKDLKKLDKKWDKENVGMAGWIKIHNAAADKMNGGEIDRINNKPEYKDVKDFTDFQDPKVRAYHKDMEDAFNSAFLDAGSKIGLNPSGTKKYELQYQPNGEQGLQLVSTVTGKNISHADNAPDVYDFQFDSDGKISGITWQGEIKHYGIKGMRWGVTTKDRAAQKAPTDVTVSQPKPGKFAKTSGGKNQPLHPDAQVALVAKQKAKSSTTDSLSNAELRTAVQRMQLEQQFTQLEFSSDRRSRGARFVAGLFGSPRYGGKKLQFEDMDEKQGAQVRDALSKAHQEYVKANTK